MKKRFIFLLLFLFLSCTKFGKNITVKGYVLNPITGQGIGGVEVWLQRSTADLPGGQKTVKTAITDADGCYELDKFGLSKYTAICVIGDRYSVGWTLDKGQSYVSDPSLNVKKRKTMHADFHAVEYGEIKTPIYNINCQGPSDSLIFKRNYISFNDVSVFQPFILTGCYNNDGAFAKVPSGDYSIEWTVIRNGVSQSFSHVLTVPGNGQAQYVLNY